MLNPLHDRYKQVQLRFGLPPYYLVFYYLVSYLIPLPLYNQIELYALLFRAKSGALIITPCFN